MSGGDLLKALGPIGPPLSFAPGDEGVKGSNPSESRKDEPVLGVKRIEVREAQQSGNPGSHDGAHGNSAPTVSDSGVERGSRDVTEKYVNIPSGKYIYVHIYVCICVYTYLCKMDERRSFASWS